MSLCRGGLNGGQGRGMIVEAPSGQGSARRMERQMRDGGGQERGAKPKEHLGAGYYRGSSGAVGAPLGPLLLEGLAIPDRVLHGPQSSVPTNPPPRPLPAWPSPATQVPAWIPGRETWHSWSRVWPSSWQSRPGRDSGTEAVSQQSLGQLTTSVAAGDPTRPPRSSGRAERRELEHADGSCAPARLVQTPDGGGACGPKTRDPSRWSRIGAPIPGGHPRRSRNLLPNPMSPYPATSGGRSQMWWFKYS